KQETKKPAPKRESFNFSLGFLKDKRIGVSFGIVLLMMSVFLFLAFLGYLFAGPSDQSVVMADPETPLRTNAAETNNWLGYMGATVSHYLIFRWFGLAAFLFP